MPQKVIHKHKWLTMSLQAILLFGASFTFWEQHWLTAGKKSFLEQSILAFIEAN